MKYLNKWLKKKVVELNSMYRRLLIALFLLIMPFHGNAKDLVEVFTTNTDTISLHKKRP